MAMGRDHGMAARRAAWSRWGPMNVVKVAPLFAAVALASVLCFSRADARVLRAHTIEVRLFKDLTSLSWFASHYDFALLYEFPNSTGYFQAETLKKYNPNMKVVGYKDAHFLQTTDPGWTVYNGNYAGIQTQLAQAIGTSDTTIQLTNASAFPTSSFWIKVDNETIEIASRSGNALTVKSYGSGVTGRGIATIRAADGGGNWAAASHSAGAAVYLPKEDYFLHDVATGSRLYYSSYGCYHMDVSNPKFRSDWAQEALKWVSTYFNSSTSGLDPAGPHFDGIFADDVWIDIAYAQNTSKMARVKDDQYGSIAQAKVNSFHSDMLAHVTNMKQVLGSYILIENSGSDVSEDYVDIADGAMHEEWMHAAWWSSTADPAESTWLNNIGSMQIVSAKGKYYLAQDNLNYSGLPAGRDTQVFKFGFASYLLATNSVYPNSSKTSFRHRPYVDTTQPVYYQNYYYACYDFDPGVPLAPYYIFYQDKTKGIDVYGRDYTNVIALVNPSSESASPSSSLDATVSLPGTFQELQPDGTLGPSVTSVTVKNKYGVVMVRTKPIGSPIVSLQQTIDKLTAPPGGTVTYTFVYKNTGTVSATAFGITDVLPSQVSFIAGSAKLNGTAVVPDPILPDGKTVQMPVGDLAGGQQGTFVFQVLVH
ncbi:MAG: putative glycoside hydrolase [Armatimonadota bacterium]